MLLFMNTSSTVVSICAVYRARLFSPSLEAVGKETIIVNYLLSWLPIPTNMQA